MKVDRTPYRVEYYQEGVKKVIRRVPPPKLHVMEPQDEVTITRKKNDDWDAGDEVTIQGISRRQPNTLMVVNEEGKHTFLPYFDVEFEGAADVSFNEDGTRKKRDPIGTQYLLWP